MGLAKARLRVIIICLKSTLEAFLFVKQFSGKLDKSRLDVDFCFLLDAFPILILAALERVCSGIGC